MYKIINRCYKISHSSNREQHKMSLQLNTHVNNGVRKIIFNDLKSKNAISYRFYDEIRKVLIEDAQNEEVIVTVITGAGDCFSSGLHIKEAIKEDKKLLDEYFKNCFIAYRDMIKAFIDYPKLLVAFVNGACVGIGFAICTLCDIIYATPNATFKTIIGQIGFSIEGLGSFLLPRILGRSKASEMIFLGDVLSAEDALTFGLVSKIVPFNEKEVFTKNLCNDIKLLDSTTMQQNKKLIRSSLRKDLLDCHDRECENILKLQNSEEFFYNLCNYFFLNGYLAGDK